MGSKTEINWASATWNPITGCDAISPGCANCYARKMAYHFAGNGFYPSKEDGPFSVTYHESQLHKPLGWKKAKVIFVVSQGDLFHDAVPPAIIERILGVMAYAKQHTFILCTKRPERMKLVLDLIYAKAFFDDNYYMKEYLADKSLWPGERPFPLANVIGLVSCENQEYFDSRWSHFKDVPLVKLGVSAEPLLGQISMVSMVCDRRPDWVIVGGESTSQGRPMHPGWARQLRDECDAWDIPFNFKQWGRYAPIAPLPETSAGFTRTDVLVNPESGLSIKIPKRAVERYHLIYMGYCAMKAYQSKKDSGRLLDGNVHDGHLFDLADG